MHVSYAIFVTLLRDQMAKTWKTMFQGKRKDKTYLLKRTIIYVLVFGTGILVLGRNLTSNGRNVYTIYIFAKKNSYLFIFIFYQILLDNVECIFPISFSLICNEPRTRFNTNNKVYVCCSSLDCSDRLDEIYMIRIRLQ